MKELILSVVFGVCALIVAILTWFKISPYTVAMAGQRLFKVVKRGFVFVFLQNWYAKIAQRSDKIEADAATILLMSFLAALSGFAFTFILFNWELGDSFESGWWGLALFVLSLFSLLCLFRVTRSLYNLVKLTLSAIWGARHK